MHILSRVRARYKAAVSTYYHELISRKVDIKLRYVYRITCSFTGKLIKAAACLYYHVFIYMNVNIKLRSVKIFTRSSTGKLT